jgi:protein-S-isoprenylcysteine O-methyltransferase Ste14
MATLFEMQRASLRCSAAANVKTELLIADGPYRLVRNPLYFGNLLMVLGMGP